MGDFNEDPRDNEEDGMHMLMEACNLINVCEEFHQSLPSTRNNSRSIDHILVTPGILPTIRRAGLLPKDTGFSNSDHQGLFIDLTPNVLQTKNIPLQPPSLRKLRLHNAPKVEWYILQVLERAHSHNISKRLEKLQHDIAANGFNEPQTVELNNIDAKMTEIMLTTEQELSPDSTPFPFSVQLLEQINSVRLIKRLRNLKQKGKTHEINEMVAYTPSMEALAPKSLDDINLILHEARHELKAMQEEADEIRDIHHDQVYEKAAELHNKDKMILIKELKEREKQGRIFKKISYVLTPFQHQAITRLGIPAGMMQSTTKEIWDFLQLKERTKEKIDWEFTEDENYIQFRLREWNILHFNQSHATPLASATWEKHLTPEEIVDSQIPDIIQRAIDADTTLHPDSKCLLEEMKRKVSKPMPDDKTTASLEEFQTFFRHTPEDRSSSPSGLHLGHYKAASLSQEFSSILWNIAILALHNKHALPRWHHSATVLLEKTAGHPYIHKFRTIHLIESDLNFLMRKIWGRDFMQHNEIAETFHNNQYGGRKGRLPTSAILNKVLTLDVIRYYGDDMVIIDNDAKACYDRVIPYVTLYMLRRLGMPIHLSQFMCTVLNSMDYSIKIGSGITTTYSATDNRLYGTGQGAGWSPPCWAANSDVISCVMEKHTPGMLIEHPNRQISSHRHVDVFVDDSSLGITKTAFDNFNPDSNAPVKKGKDLYEQAQLNTQFYSRLLFTTGGLLAIHKCIAYILLFEWYNGTRRLKKVKDSLEPLKIQQGINQDFDFIKIQDPDEAFRMLGGFVAPDGNTRVQCEILYKKAKQWGLKITFSHLNEQEVWVAYHQVLIPALIYPLGAIPVDEEQCRKIMGPALKAMLPKIGMGATTARDLVHAVPRHGGPDIADIYTHAGTMRIKMFIGHWRKDDATAEILKISMGCCQQEVGIGPNLLEKDYRKYGWILQHCWIKVLWKFLDDINGTILIDNDWNQQRHTNDIYLMNLVHDMALSKDQIRQINQCRLFKRITFVSEILHHDLQDFHPNIWDPSTPMSSNMEERFPTIEIPKNYWLLWKNVLVAVRSANSIPIRNLGPLHTKHQAHWLASKDLRYVYQRQHDGHTVHKLQTRYKNTLTYSLAPLFQTTVTEYNFLMYVTPDSCNDEIKITYRNRNHHNALTSVFQPLRNFRQCSSNLYQAVTKRLSQTSLFTNQHGSNPPPYTISYYDDTKHSLYRQWWKLNRPTPVHQLQSIKSSIPIHFDNRSDLDTNFIQLYQALHPSLKRNIGRITSITYLPGLLTALENGNIIGVSDASVSDENYASHAYTIISTDEKYQIMGVAPVDCDEDDTESTRAEKSGVLAIVTLVSILTDMSSTVIQKQSANAASPPISDHSYDLWKQIWTLTWHYTRP